MQEIIDYLISNWPLLNMAAVARMSGINRQNLIKAVRAGSIPKHWIAPLQSIINKLKQTTMYVVTTSGMQQYINANNYNEEFDNLKDAITAFDYQCERLGYDNVEINEDGSRDAGGRGYDYRIELTNKG